MNLISTELFSLLMTPQKASTKTPAGSIVAILGASAKPDRFSFKAVRMLSEYGYKPIPVHPSGHAVNGIKGVKSLGEIRQPVDTLTMYVNSDISDKMTEEIIRLNPRRIIFNPGSENRELAEMLEAAGIEVVFHCTLVMLNSGTY
jgi:predicted CoA-binding protein